MAPARHASRPSARNSIAREIATAYTVGVILGLFVSRGHRRIRHSGWALLDERRGAFLAVGALREGSDWAAKSTRWATLGNRAAGCEVVAVNFATAELQAVVAACAPVPRIVTIATEKWTRATMPSVPTSERTDPAMIYGAFEFMARSHREAHQQLEDLELPQRPAAAAAALIALGVALTSHDVAARVCTEWRRTPDSTEKRESREKARARLELIEHRGEEGYEQRVRLRARELHREEERRRRSSTSSARPPAATPIPLADRRDLIAAKVAVARLEVLPGTPRYEQLVSDMLESARRKRAAVAPAMSP